MSELFRFYAFLLLALRVLIDLVVSVIIYYQTESLVVGIGVMVGCSVCPVFLYFGIKNEQFRGRYGHRIYYSEPYAYWFIVAFLILLHLIFTGLMINTIHR